jgi:hypothetical protein
MATVAKFVGTIPWWTLVPDDQHKVVISGLGEFLGMDYLAASLSHDRRTLAAYLPDARTFTVDSSQLAGSHFTSSWFNPRSGETIAGAPVTAAAKLEFTPPGSGDWAFILKAD